MQRKRFSDFSHEETLEGEKLPISEILDEVIFIKAYRIIDSKAVKNKQCLVLQYELEDSSNLYASFTNSVVLMRQIEEYASELPFETIIVKRSNYYTFT